MQELLYASLQLEDVTNHIQDIRRALASAGRAQRLLWRWRLTPTRARAAGDGVGAAAVVSDDHA